MKLQLANCFFWAQTVATYSPSSTRWRTPQKKIKRKVKQIKSRQNVI